MGHPYRTARLEAMGKEPEGLMPISPTFGPDITCPKCGSQSYTPWHGPPSRDACSRPTFCYEHKRVYIKWWPWPKKCKHPGTHLHQKCINCGGHWVSWPLCDKPKKEKK